MGFLQYVGSGCEALDAHTKVVVIHDVTAQPLTDATLAAQPQGVASMYQCINYRAVPRRAKIFHCHTVNAVAAFASLANTSHELSYGWQCPAGPVPPPQLARAGAPTIWPLSIRILPVALMRLCVSIPESLI
jgi:hypothetical protein